MLSEKNLCRPEKERFLFRDYGVVLQGKLTEIINDRRVPKSLRKSRKNNRYVCVKNEKLFLRLVMESL